MNQIKSAKSMIDSGEKNLCNIFSRKFIVQGSWITVLFSPSSSIVKNAFSRYHFATQEFCIFWFDDFLYGRESYKERVFYCPQPHSLDLFVLFTLFKFHFFIYRAPGLIAWARGEFIWNYKVLRLMIMHFDIRDKVMKILINIDCKVYRICIIRGNFCLRNLAKILLLWSLRKLLRWCIERNLHQVV